MRLASRRPSVAADAEQPQRQLVRPREPGAELERRPLLARRRRTGRAPGRSARRPPAPRDERDVAAAPPASPASPTTSSSASCSAASRDQVGRGVGRGEAGRAHRGPRSARERARRRSARSAASAQLDEQQLAAERADQRERHGADADDAPRRSLAACAVERGVVAEDRALELLQRAAGSIPSSSTSSRRPSR